MAVATSSSHSTKPPEPMGLAVSSIIGAILALAAAALVLRGVPVIWDGLASSMGIHDPIVRLSVQVVAQLTAAVGIIFLVSRIGVGQISSGLRGGIFLMIAVAFVGFFALKGLYTAIGEGFSFGHIVVMLFYVVIVFLLVQLFRTGRFTQWSVALDKAGWFDTHTHKRTQGLKVRRLTILGILLVAGSGIYTLINHNYLPRNTEITLPGGEKVSNRLGDWVVNGDYRDPLDAPKPAPKADAPDAERVAFEAEKERVRLENRARPRMDNGITLLPDLQFTIPLILIAATLWLAWRVVNYPVFADFLIATEAEINKVSWTSRRALFRDAIVVLVSLVLVTIFLFFVDVFWGWLLSRSIVGVLPTEAEREAAKAANVSPAPVKDW